MLRESIACLVWKPAASYYSLSSASHCNDDNGPICSVTRCWKIFAVRFFWRVMKGFFFFYSFCAESVPHYELLLFHISQGFGSLISFKIFLIVVHCSSIYKARLLSLSAPSFNEFKVLFSFKSFSHCFVEDKRKKSLGFLNS